MPGRRRCAARGPENEAAKPERLAEKGAAQGAATPLRGKPQRRDRGTVPAASGTPAKTPSTLGRPPPLALGPASGAKWPSKPPATPRSAPRSSASPPESGAGTSSATSDNVKVVIRIRPARPEEEAAGSACVQQRSGQVLEADGPGHERRRRDELHYDAVLGADAAQDDVFQLVGLPVVEHCMSGLNASIFAYGQTGSGKTHTMTGMLSNADQRGLAPRIFDALFARIAQEETRLGREKLRYSVRCTYLEIYREELTDLLRPAGPPLALRLDAARGAFVDGLEERDIFNSDDAMALIRCGSEHRRSAATAMNADSSRSHAVLACQVESMRREDSGLASVRSSRLYLVDLAGSERVRASGAGGAQLRETCAINSSLTTLGRVIAELVEAQRRGAAARHHVPYRDSRLTFLLQDCLGGNARTVIVAAVSPAAEHAGETRSTLEFAARAKCIRNRAVVNRDTRGSADALRGQLACLERELELARSESRGPLLEELAAAQADADRERAAASAASEEAATVRVDAARAAVDARRHRKEAARWEGHAFALQLERDALVAAMVRAAGAGTAAAAAESPLELAQRLGAERAAAVEGIAAEQSARRAAEDRAAAAESHSSGLEQALEAAERRAEAAREQAARLAARERQLRGAYKDIQSIMASLPPPTPRSTPREGAPPAPWHALTSPGSSAAAWESSAGEASSSGDPSAL
ncbi:hypothetical protein WJX81_007629 [Elliptochloris bilobata]|uniref:Kinesin-like protein n=1 Tax=Elliptochloris bilobata TaxID=381761 RepID=A0AAW1S5F7_9CHLO